MTAFLKDIHGAYYPISRVTEISKKLDNDRHYVYLKGERSIEVSSYELNDFISPIVSTFAASPDTDLISYWPDENLSEGYYIHSIPVIGWAVNVSGTLMPITANGINDAADSNSFDVRHSNGVVVNAAYGVQYNTFEEWKNEQRKSERRTA